MTDTMATESYAVRRGRVFYAYGFRPFFLLAGLFAAVSLPVWIGQWLGYGEVPAGVSPVVWHGHEMLFGYTMAVIAGFLLTASANWLARKPFAGRGLFLLTLLWLLGRLVYWQAAWLPLWLVAVVDLGFAVALIGILAPPLIQGRALRQMPLLGVLVLLLLADGLTYADGFGFDLDPRLGLVLGVDLVVMLIGIMGGRIVPAFTTNALRAQGASALPVIRPWLERLVIPGFALFAISDVLFQDTIAAGAIALAVAALNGCRLAGWQTRLTLRQPILWVLHAGYAWLVLGIALRGFSDLWPAIPATAAMHALTAGAIGVMTLGVMSRVALGHTGRRLVVSGWITLAYGLVNLAALLRVFVPMLAPDFYASAITGASLLWSLAFLIFSLVYWPILTRSRPDGRAG